MKPTEFDRTILRAFNVGGAMTVSELAPQVKLEREVLKTTCERLWANHFLEREWMGAFKPCIYTLSGKGRKAMEEPRVVRMGEMPQPRSHYASEPLAPQKWNIREGGDAHEKCLSRRGDTFVEHRPPLTLGAAS